MPALHRLLSLAGRGEMTDAEITRLAGFVGLSEAQFIQRFTRLRSDRRGLSLAEQPDGACVFLQGRDCAVQPVKPQQCRDFPNLWNFPGFERICRAIPRLVSQAEHRDLIQRATGRALPPTVAVVANEPGTHLSFLQSRAEAGVAAAILAAVEGVHPAARTRA